MTAASPDMPEIMPAFPDGPAVMLDGGDFVIPSMHPRLGIDAEDIGGQLGNFFGVPDGEGAFAFGLW